MNFQNQGTKISLYRVLTERIAEGIILGRLAEGNYNPVYLIHVSIIET
ncbi:hypothetical protein CLV31_1274 [Algoriphagus aquaeductus]|uniref:Uncharacterized protein n=1 Tax=Algoriphagus aquaeductus TaxID=475299 RepID=A0A326RUN3_9BACT|nr:hypothetical protein [Algoriphagus aquaeductus]PZV76055.1 hypothetical protein CLV31_1274 [Algoriphagus aquaeductus]